MAQVVRRKSKTSPPLQNSPHVSTFPGGRHTPVYLFTHLLAYTSSLASSLSRQLPFPLEAAAVPYNVPSQQMCRSHTHTTSVIIIGSYTGGGSSSESSSSFTAPYLRTFPIASGHVANVDEKEPPRTQRLVARGRHSHVINVTTGKTHT